MARKMREVIKLELKDLFLDGALTEDQQRAVMKSELWPVFVAAYSGTDRNIRVCGYMDHRQQLVRTFYERIVFSTKEGFNCGLIKKDAVGDNDGEYVVATLQNTCGSASDSYLANVLRTKNIRYAISKLQKGNHDARVGLRDVANTVPNMLSRKIREVVDMACDRMYGDSISQRPFCSLPVKVSTALAELYMKEIESHQIPDTIITVLTDQYKDYSNKRNKFNDAMDTVSEMFSGEKYWLFTNVRGGVMVGKISGMPVQVALDEYRKDSLPEYHKLSYYVEDSTDMPLKWYPSMDDIPADVRKQLDIQLVMLKAHANFETLIPDARVAPNVYPAIGAALSNGGSGCHILYLNA